MVKRVCVFMNTYENRVLQHEHGVRGGFPDSIWSGRLVLMDMDDGQHWLIIMLENFFGMVSRWKSYKNKLEREQSKQKQIQTHLII